MNQLGNKKERLKLSFIEIMILIAIIGSLLNIAITIIPKGEIKNDIINLSNIN